MDTVSSSADGYRRMTFDENLERIGLTEDELRGGGPHPPLEFLLRYHAFAKAGTERAGYGPIAYSAFEGLGLNDGDHIPPIELWERFVEGCEEEGKGVNERGNEGVVTGLAELTNREGNLFAWVRDGIDGECNLKHLYLELKSIKGIGHKIAALILRDVVDSWGIEYRVAPHNRQYLHPVDRWVSRVGETLWPELEGATPEETAQLLAEKCNEHNVPNTRFNQGAYYLGVYEMDRDESKLETAIREGIER